MRRLARHFIGTSALMARRPSKETTKSENIEVFGFRLPSNYVYPHLRVEKNFIRSIMKIGYDVYVYNLHVEDTVYPLWPVAKYYKVALLLQDRCHQCWVVIWGCPVQWGHPVCTTRPGCTRGLLSACVVVRSLLSRSTTP